MNPGEVVWFVSATANSRIAVQGRIQVALPSVASYRDWVSGLLGTLLILHEFDSARMPIYTLASAGVVGAIASTFRRSDVILAERPSKMGIVLVASLAVWNALVEHDLITMALFVIALATARWLRYGPLIQAAWATLLAGAAFFCLSPSFKTEVFETRLSLGLEHPSRVAWLAVVTSLLRGRLSKLDVPLFFLTLLTGARVPLAIYSLVIALRSGQRHLGLLVLALAGIIVTILVVGATRGFDDVGDGNGRTPIWTGCSQLLEQDFPGTHTTEEIGAWASKSVIELDNRRQDVFDCHQSYLDTFLKFGLAAPVVAGALLLRQTELVVTDYKLGMVFAGLTLISSQMVEALTVHTLVLALFIPKDIVILPVKGIA